MSGEGLGLGSMQFGYDSNKVEKYLSDIKTEALDTAKAAIMATGDLETCCKQNWAGQACEDYIKILKRDAEHCAEMFQELYDVLVAEVNQLNAAMKNKDANLFK